MPQLVLITYLGKVGHVKIFIGSVGRKEGNVLFNDALNTFYLRLYGIRLMVKDHSDSERGNPLLPHGLLFPISSKGSFICIIPQTGWHTPQPLLHQFDNKLFYPWAYSRSNMCMFTYKQWWNWLEREIAQWVHPMKDRSDDPSHHERTWGSVRTPRPCPSLLTIGTTLCILEHFIENVYIVLSCLIK